MDKLNSTIIKDALYWRYRFKLNYTYCADEVCYSDFLFISKSMYVGEIEIKISIADLKKDFDKSIHGAIKNKTINRNYFYFAVPLSIYDKAKEIINMNGNYYGIITIKDDYPFDVYTKQKPKLIKPCFGKTDLIESIKQSIIMRLTSKIAHAGLNRLKDYVQNIKNEKRSNDVIKKSSW